MYVLVGNRPSVVPLRTAQQQSTDGSGRTFLLFRGAELLSVSATKPGQRQIGFGR